MLDTQTILLIALAVVGALALIVGGALTHHIGGFLRTVEREAEEEAKRREEEQRLGAPEATDNTQNQEHDV